MDSVARLASGVHTRPMDIIANIWNWLAAAPVFIQVAAGILLSAILPALCLWVKDRVAALLDWAYRP